MRMDYRLLLLSLLPLTPLLGSPPAFYFYGLPHHFTKFLCFFETFFPKKTRELLKVVYGKVGR